MEMPGLFYDADNVECATVACHNISYISENTLDIATSAM